MIRVPSLCTLVTFGSLALASSFLKASDFGNVGLIKVPTARMADDGSLRATFSREKIADIYNVTFQGAPWLEATFRYSIFNPRNLQRSADDLRDRSYEVKARVLSEGKLVPQFALGVRDILGTGIWEAEYAVVSKVLGPLDVSLGMGWGRLAARGYFDNPLGQLDEGFKRRPEKAGGTFGGESRSKSYFRGASAFFGGLRYKHKDWPLDLLMEYNSDDYSREVYFKTIVNPSPWNFAVEWRPRANLNLALSWLHGNAIGIRMSGSLDTKSMPNRKKGGNFYSASEPRSLSRAPDSLDLQAWYDRTLYDAERSGLRLNKASINQKQDFVALEVENTGYAITADAVHSVLAIAEAQLPRSVDLIEVMLRDEGLVAPTILYRRQQKRNVIHSRVERKKRVQITKSHRVVSPSNITRYQYPFLNLGADLSTRTQLMDPEAPFAKQIYARFSARLSLTSQLNLWALFGQDIYNDFTNTRVSNSRIQKVRSDINRYLTEGESGLDQLFLEYKSSLGDSLHLRSYVGVLESMYAGIGSEILFEPYASRLAIGLTINALRQRGFKKNMDFLDYKTTTGYLSAYYASPWYNLDFAIHAGRYLAKDKGATFEARRTFDNGFSIGAFFTRTDLPAELFGEGSFDKGLFFRIPFNSLLPRNSKNSISLIVRPLDRDGGRRLEDFSGSLWFSRRHVRYDALRRNTERMIP